MKNVERKITNEDLERAKRRIAAVVQAISFPKEARDLKDGKSVKTSSKIIKLKPFMNEHDVMRVVVRSLKVRIVRELTKAPNFAQR